MSRCRPLLLRGLLPLVLALLGLAIKRLDGRAVADAARLANPSELLLESLQLLVGHVLQVSHARARALHSAQQLVELEVYGLRVAVLRVLDEEDHQERDYRRARVYDELPRIRVAERGAGHGPDDDDQHREDESPGRADNVGSGGREFSEELVHTFPLG